MIKKIAVIILITIMSTPAFANLNNVVEGKENAPVEIKVYYSITCPACGKVHIGTLEQIKKNYVNPGYAKIEYMPYPLDYVSLGVELFLSCIPTDVQHKQALNEIMSTHDDWLYSENPSAGVNAIIEKYLTPEQISFCEKDVENFQKLFNKIDVYKKKEIVKGTPSIFINGNRAKRLSYQHIKYMIDQELLDD